MYIIPHRDTSSNQAENIGSSQAEGVSHADTGSMDQSEPLFEPAVKILKQRRRKGKREYYVLFQDGTKA